MHKHRPGRAFYSPRDGSMQRDVRTICSDHLSGLFVWTSGNCSTKRRQVLPESSPFLPVIAPSTSCAKEDTEGRLCIHIDPASGGEMHCNLECNLKIQVAGRFGPRSIQISSFKLQMPMCWINVANAEVDAEGHLGRAGRGTGSVY